MTDDMHLLAAYRDLRKAEQENASQLAAVANKTRDIAKLVDDCDLSFFETPTQPNTWADTTMDSDTFLSTFYDVHLGTKTDGYKVSKSVLGKDHSGTYDIVQYIFEPKVYTRSIFVEGGMHGIELPDVFGWGRIMEYVVSSPDTAPLYRYLRDKVRIICIPILNPWGFNQSPRQYGNVNGVNINRNITTQAVWDTLVDNQNGFQGKGTAPFSEVESNILMSAVLRYIDEIDFLINQHVGIDFGNYDQFLYYVTGDVKMVTGLTNAVNWLDDRLRVTLGREPVNLFTDAETSYMIQYFRNVLGLSATTWEMVPGIWGGSYNGSTDLFYNVLQQSNYLVGILNSFSIGAFTEVSAINKSLQILQARMEMLDSGLLIDYDNFDRANAAKLGYTAFGHQWIDTTGSFGISGNAAIAKTLFVENARNYTDVGFSNIDASINIIWQVYGGMHFRYKDVNNYLLARINPEGLALSSYVDNVSTNIGAYAFTPVAGTRYTVRVVANGTSIKVYLDGTERISVTNSNFLTETKVGMRVASSDITTKFDNFSCKKIS